MPRIGSILRFREDRFFEGAIQLDWFYDKDRARAAATAFVFHGPRYFGVDASDIGVHPKQLVDTCSFSKLICERLYGDSEEQNPFIMGIAGYGAGKSHLALALSVLFSGHDSSATAQIIENMAQADSDISQEIRQYITKPNLVIALNGMRDFNLNYGILNAAQKALLLHGHDDTSLKSLTRSHEIAENFLVRNFDRLRDQFVEAAAGRFNNSDPHQLLALLRDSLLTNSDAFEVINRVFYQESGSYIRWDEGIAASDVLQRLSDSVCGDRGYFNKILIMFDEFGRFIEYASRYPSIAAESALQQIFEAVQNSQGKIIMVGLIQSDLRSYLARVDKSANIIRYVGRYETAEKVYLSSNLETIFAHLIDRRDPEAFDHYVHGHYSRKSEDLQALHTHLLSWLPTASRKSVWREFSNFSKIIAEGSYPLHPIATWMLTTLSEWLQQRSALTFVHDGLNSFRDTEIDQFGDLPYIRATDLIHSDLFQELLVAEEIGRQQSEFCIQYNTILRKKSDQLDQTTSNLLAANVIARIGRFRTSSRNDAESLLAYCSGLSLEEVDSSLKFLENELGVLSFDPLSNSFDFVEDAIGATDFKRTIDRKRRSTKVNLSLIFDGEVREVLGLATTQQSGFGDRHYVTTQEWDFTQEVVWSEELTDDRLKLYYDEWKKSRSPDKPKGKVVWIYVAKDSPGHLDDELRKRINRHNLFQAPIIFMWLDDATGQLYDTLCEWQAARSLSEEEKQKFSRFILEHNEKMVTALKGIFERHQHQRLQLTPDGVVEAAGPVRNSVSAAFEAIYHSVVPFMFEGFRAKNLTKAKKNLSYIARSLCSGLVGYQWVLAQNTEIRNRVQTVLYAGSKGSWGVLNEDYKLVAPANPVLSMIYGELDKKLAVSLENGISLGEVLDQLTAPPYGANDYSAALLLVTYLVLRQATSRITYGSDRIRLSGWAEKAFIDKGTGIELGVFYNTIVHQVDLEGSRNKFLAVCNDIETNSSLSKWKDLLEQLNKLCKEEEPPSDLADKIEVCRRIASDGQNIWSEYDQFINSQIIILNKTKDNGDVRQALNVLLQCQNKLSYGETLDRYVYGGTERKKLSQLMDAANKILCNSFDQWMNNLKCNNYAQFSGFYTAMKHIVKDLKSAGYNDFAYRLDTHIKQIADNMEEIKTRQSVKEITVRFIQTCKPTKYTSYRQLAEWKDQGNKLIEYITKALPRISARSFIEEVNARLQDVDKYLIKYRNELSVIIEAAYEISSLLDCHTLLSRVRSMLDRSLRTEDEEDIREIADALTNLLRDIDSLDKTKDDPELTKLNFASLVRKWEHIDCISATAVLESTIKQYKREWNELDAAWVEHYLSIPADTIFNWDIEECMKWKQATEVPPAYLVPESKTRLENIRSVVERRLEEIPVEAAVAAYNRLNEHQKKQFLEILGLHDTKNYAIMRESIP